MRYTDVYGQCTERYLVLMWSMRMLRVVSTVGSVRCVVRVTKDVFNIFCLGSGFHMQPFGTVDRGRCDHSFTLECSM